jgi:anthranilate synthase component II
VLKDSKFRVFVVDNYDSFTYNLVHLVEQSSIECVVKRNDALKLEELEDFSHIIIGPGPGLPDESGLVLDIIQRYSSSKSILGICLGMQALLISDGIGMVNLQNVQHGAQDLISLQSDSKLFADIPQPIKVGRYHSWAFTLDDTSKNYRVIAESSDGHIMAIEHVSKPLFGIQFHPESIMTEHGFNMIENWLKSKPYD